MSARALPMGAEQQRWRRRRQVVGRHRRKVMLQSAAARSFDLAANEAAPPFIMLPLVSCRAPFVSRPAGQPAGRLPATAGSPARPLTAGRPASVGGTNREEQRKTPTMSGRRRARSCLQNCSRFDLASTCFVWLLLCFEQEHAEKPLKRTICLQTI